MLVLGAAVGVACLRGDGVILQGLVLELGCNGVRRLLNYGVELHSTSVGDLFGLADTVLDALFYRTTELLVYPVSGDAQ